MLAPLPVYAEKKRTPRLDRSLLNTINDPNHRYDQTSRAVPQEERETMRELAKNSYRPAIAPAWLKHQRQVLRFYAYFQEAVTEHPKENYRVRNCTIFYYLEDGTMMVTEQKVENSGVPQGAFLKRHRIPRPEELGGGYYTHEDLQTGKTLILYSRAFRLLDCDEFTRDFYENAIGVEMGQEEDAPGDVFSMTQSMDAARRHSPEPSDREQTDNLEYRHLALGGNRKNAKLEQYLENDGKVLRFQAFWDDHTLYGARMYFTIHYFLADNSVEILDNHVRNSGRDPYPVFWKRAPLKKNPNTVAAPGMMEPDAVIFRPEDLIVGTSIIVFSRKLEIFDCDDFTRTFYRTYMNLEQASIPIEVPPLRHAALNPPPHNGVGTDEDSLANCAALVPKPHKKDLNKMMTMDGKVLRFEAILQNGRAEDDNRKFVVQFYLADDEVGVFEVPQRNSGHSGTKFAKKTRKRNPATDQWFCKQDFFVGNVVEVHSAPLLIVRADEMTLKFMEAKPEEYPVADIYSVLAKIRGLKDDFARSGETLTPEDVAALAERQGVYLCEHELVTLLRNFGEIEPPGLIFTAKLLETLG